jgi:hypothetical protein
MTEEPSLRGKVDGVHGNSGVPALFRKKITRFANHQDVVMPLPEGFRQLEDIELPTAVDVGRICQQYSQR